MESRKRTIEELVKLWVEVHTEIIEVAMMRRWRDYTATMLRRCRDDSDAATMTMLRRCCDDAATMLAEASEVD